MNLSPPQSTTQRREVAVYPYRDETGRLLYEHVRYEPKGFSFRRPDGKGGHEWTLGDVQRVLYRLPEILARNASSSAHRRGREDADRLWKIGLAATATTTAPASGMKT